MNNLFRKLFGFDGRVYHPIDPKPPAPEYSKEEHVLRYPRAAQTNKMKTQGKFRLGYPEGIVIHFTAGSDDALNTRNYMASKKLLAIVIDKLGHVWQDFPLDEWGWHAGRSSWRGFTGSLNDDFIGIEVVNGGKLSNKGNNCVTWFGTVVHDVRQGPNVLNCKGGIYENFTAVQEDELIKLVVWLVKNSNGKIRIENIVGHDEIAPGRKNDPGWSLSMTMRDFRKRISDELKKDS